MSEFRADLHCHTTASDGSSSPKEIIDLAVKKGMQALAITDHDTIKGYSEIRDYAVKQGVLLIPGVEFSSECKDKGVHILGLGIDPHDMGIQEFLKKHFERRQIRMEAMVACLNREGIALSVEDVLAQSKEGLVGRVHIGKALVEKGMAKDVRNAFSNWLNSKAPGYVYVQCAGIADTIRTIHQAKGVAILAHPHLIKGDWVKNNLLGFNFDGLEVFYGRFLRTDCQKWMDFVRQRGWKYSGGSDFHGSIGGSDLGRSWIDGNALRNLLRGTAFEVQIQTLYGKSLSSFI
jgi:3',5'-nucleoside bisphosphate phosphatase